MTSDTEVFKQAQKLGWTTIWYHTTECEESREVLNSAQMPDYWIVSFMQLPTCLVVDPPLKNKKVKYGFVYDEFSQKLAKKPCIKGVLSNREHFEVICVDWRYLTLLTHFGIKTVIHKIASIPLGPDEVFERQKQRYYEFCESEGIRIVDRFEQIYDVMDRVVFMQKLEGMMKKLPSELNCF